MTSSQFGASRSGSRRGRGDVACCRGGPGRPSWDPFASPLFRLYMARVSDRSRPLNLAGSVQVGKQQLVQALPDTRLLPRSQLPPARHPAAEAELLRQMLPTDPAVQDEQDPLQREPIIERLPTRVAKTPLALRQQRLDPLPQPIRHIPRFRPHRHPPSLTTGADGLRYRRTGPFIQLELLSQGRRFYFGPSCRKARGFRAATCARWTSSGPTSPTSSAASLKS